MSAPPLPRAVAALEDAEHGLDRLLLAQGDAEREVEARRADLAAALYSIGWSATPIITNAGTVGQFTHPSCPARTFDLTEAAAAALAEDAA
jgi:hypothetical protein